MILCLACCHKDADLALKNAEWMREIDVGRGFEALLVINIEGAEKKMHEPILKALQATFSKVHFTTCSEDERMWPEEQRKWPWSENLTWTSAARYVRDNLRQPWLFLEADAVLLHESALNEIQADYVTSGQPFLGQLVDTKDETGRQVPAHMSGVAVYPSDVTRFHDSALQGGGLAFDMVLKDMTTTAMKDSRLIHHCYHSPPFENLGHMRRIRKGAALYHQDKSGSLIDRLREARGLPLSIPSLPIKTISTGSPAPAKPMITDILLKTYPADYPWLGSCIRSIEKFCSGFRRVIVISPDLNYPITISSALDRITAGQKATMVEPDIEPGYLHQQVVKLHADRYSDADQWLTIDSDCVFTRPITPETFVRDGRIVWLKTPMAQAGSGQGWLESMRQWFGSTPQFEYMRRHPFLLPKFLLEEMRKFTQFMHGKSLSEYIMGSGSFSEFNCAGLLAEAKFKDRFLFLDTTKDEIPSVCVRQWHSHDGVETALEEIETILGTNNQPGGGGASPPEFAGSHSVKKHPESPGAEEQKPALPTPEQNPLSFAIATLAAEAQKSPLHKARMVAQLVKAGLIAAKAKKPKPRRMAKV